MNVHETSKDKVLLFFILWVAFPLWTLSNVSSVKLSQLLVQEEVFVEKVGLEEGLLSNIVGAIVKDADGFVWIGTLEGLTCFDGKRVRHYVAGPDSSQFLSHGSVTALQLDGDSGIWIGTDGGGLCYLNKKEGRIFHYNRPMATGTIMADNKILSMTKDRFGQIWVGTGKGVVRIEKRKDEEGNNTFQIVNDLHGALADSLKKERIMNLCEDSQGNIWAASASGALFLIEREGKHFKAVIAPPVKDNLLEALRGETIFALANGADKTILVGTSKGLYSLKQAENNQWDFKKLLLTQGQEGKGVPVTSICALADSTFWVGSSAQGLLHLNKKGELRRIKLEVGNDPEAFKSIRTLYLSSDGQLWMGNDNDGAGFLFPERQKFFHYGIKGRNPFGLKRPVVKNIHKDAHGNLWFGTWGGGVTRRDYKTGKVEDLSLLLAEKLEKPIEVVQSIVSDSYGNIWIGTVGDGLYRFDLRSRQLKHFSNKGRNGEQYLPSDDIWALWAGRDGETLWIGTYAGLAKMDIESGRVKTYGYERGGVEGLSFNDIKALYEDDEGYLWIGTEGGGLNRLDLKTEVFKHYKFKANDPFSLSNDNVYAIIKDRFGYLWIGTKGGGLNRFNPKSEKFERITSKDGLPSNSVKSIIEDDAGFIWVSTTRGIACLNPDKRQFLTFCGADGVRDIVYNIGSVARSEEGYLLFGGTSGVLVVDPIQVSKKLMIPPISITDIKINNENILPGKTFNGREVLDKALSEEPTIRLQHKENNLVFGFSAPEFSHQGGLEYGWRLVGADKDWNIGNEALQQITYSNLSPGKYSFEVRVSLKGEPKIQNTGRLSFTIAPPWYFHPSAYLVYFILLVLGFFGARHMAKVRFRMQLALEQEKNEKQKQQELTQHKLRFFTNISHEFRTPLTLLINPLKRLLAEEEKMNAFERRRQYKMMERSASSLMHLINLLLDFRKAENDKIDLKVRSRNVFEWMKEILGPFENYANQSQIFFKSDLKQANIVVWLDLHWLQTALTNLVSNALKYTPKGGEVLIQAGLCTEKERQDIVSKVVRKGAGEVQGYWWFSIKDTGKGMTTEELEHIFERFYRGEADTEIGTSGTGIGLALTRRVIEQHYGVIQVFSKVGQGTEFKVFLPVDKAPFQPEEIGQENYKTETASLPILEINSVEEELELNITEGKKTKILVVEDNKDVCTYLRDSLQNEYQVIMAENGAEGWGMVQEHLPELVITDVMMPIMNGLTLCENIKSTLTTSHIPVIMLTARAAPNQELEGVHTGADAYVTKPFYLDLLKARVEQLINSRRKLRERYGKEGIHIEEMQELGFLDRQFLEKVEEAVVRELSNPELKVEMLAAEVGMSRVNLFRKMKALLNKGPNEYIRERRLKEAARLLVHEGLGVADAIYQVGFSNRSYFNKCFKEEFEMSPSEYQRKFRKSS